MILFALGAEKRQIKFSTELTPTLDRSYEYDQAGRLLISHAGAEARHAHSKAKSR